MLRNVWLPWEVIPTHVRLSPANSMCGLELHTDASAANVVVTPFMSERRTLQMPFGTG
jgi:hypothetical protein